MVGGQGADSAECPGPTTLCGCPEQVPQLLKPWFPFCKTEVVTLPASYKFMGTKYAIICYTSKHPHKLNLNTMSPLSLAIKFSRSSPTWHGSLTLNSVLLFVPWCCLGQVAQSLSASVFLSVKWG